MDFGGVVGMEGLVGGGSSEGGGLFSSSMAFSDSEIKQTGVLCSSFLKHGRPGGSEENDWRFPKMARTEATAVPNITSGAASLYRSNTHSLFPEGEQMLSFSSTPSSKPDAMVLSSDGTLPYYHHPSASSSTPYFRNAGIITLPLCLSGAMLDLWVLEGAFLVLVLGLVWHFKREMRWSV